jgi:hypothetical protein
LESDRIFQYLASSALLSSLSDWKDMGVERDEGVLHGDEYDRQDECGESEEYHTIHWRASLSRGTHTHSNTWYDLLDSQTNNQ